MATLQRALFAGIAMSLALPLAACGASSSSSSSSGAPVDGRAFAMGLATDPGTLDPTMSSSTAARQIFTLFYDSLVYGKDDGTFVPGLAERWTSTANSVTFTLKKNVTCSDGSPFTATDVADNIKYIAEPKNGSPLLSVLVQPGTTTKADDASGVVTVTTAAADGLLLGEISGLYMLCRSGLKDHKSVTQKGAGTGPYNLTEVVPGDHYTFTPRKDYTWGPDGQSMSGKGVPTSATVRIIPNQATIANLLRSGELNYAGVTGPDAKRVPAGFKSIKTLDTSGEIWFNERAGHAGADPAVRQALVTAVDRVAFSKVATGGTGQPSTGLITLAPNPCVATDTVGPNLPKPEPTKAMQILDSAGWVKGSDGVRAKAGRKLELKLVYAATGLSARTAGLEFLTSQWQAVGAKVDLQMVPPAQLDTILFSTGAWDATATAFTFNLPSQLVGFVSGPTSPDGANFANIQNADYTKAVGLARPLVGDKSCPQWSQAEESLVKSYNPAPLFNDVIQNFYTDVQITAPALQIWGSSIRMLAQH